MNEGCEGHSALDKSKAIAFFQSNGPGRSPIPSAGRSDAIPPTPLSPSALAG